VTTIWIGIGSGLFMIVLGLGVIAVAWRQGTLRNRAGRTITLAASAIFFVIGLGIVVVGSVSANLNSRLETDVCTVRTVQWDPTRSGAAAWDIGTDCGGTLHIDPGATRQTVSEASALANSMTPGNVYRLTVQGTLRSPYAISSYLLAAKQVP